MKIWRNRQNRRYNWMLLVHNVILNKLSNTKWRRIYVWNFGSSINKVEVSISRRIDSEFHIQLSYRSKFIIILYTKITSHVDSILCWSVLVLVFAWASTAWFSSIIVAGRTLLRPWAGIARLIARVLWPWAGILWAWASIRAVRLWVVLRSRRSSVSGGWWSVISRVVSAHDDW